MFIGNFSENDSKNAVKLRYINIL